MLTALKPGIKLSAPNNGLAPYKPHRSRVVQLDMLRGLAILLVMGRHNFTSPEEAGMFQPLAESLHTIGWSGVDLFFVLSGYLIGGLLLQELHTYGYLNIWRFLLRRALRIYPVYFTYLLWFVLWSNYLAASKPANHSLLNTCHALWPNLLHLQNYLDSPCTQTWSLAVEEHFYLLLPCVLAFITSQRYSIFFRPAISIINPPATGKGVQSIPQLPLIAAALIVACLSCRLYASIGVPFDLYHQRYPTQFNLDTLFFGVLIAYCQHFIPSSHEWARRYRRILLVVGVLLISPMLLIKMGDGIFVQTFGITFLYCGYGCILIAIVQQPLDNSRTGRLLKSLPLQALATIGYFSYPMYLWHQDLTNMRLTEKVIFLFSRTSIPKEIQWIYGGLVWVLMSVGIGVFLLHYVEKPVLALRDQWLPARSNSV
ncbi:MAG: acyltransferase [Abitibacteriaceae bacterium]|nr:acyltransferase [Abditibacteriaceae bacterium]